MPIGWVMPRICRRADLSLSRKKYLLMTKTDERHNQITGKILTLIKVRFQVTDYPLTHLSVISLVLCQITVVYRGKTESRKARSSRVPSKWQARFCMGVSEGDLWLDP